MSQCHEGYDRPCGEQCVYPRCDQGARHLSCPPDDFRPKHREQNDALGYATIPVGQELPLLAWDEVNTTGSGVHLYDDQIKDLLFSWWKELPGEIKEQIASQF